MGKTTFIYALCEPDSRTVRYIGKADKPLARFKQHLSSSIKRSTYLGNWLRSVLSTGEKPALVVLREVAHDQWEVAEERYIRLARGCGLRLVNSTDGGEGQVNPNEETRAKIGSGSRGKPVSVETRDRIRTATSGENNHNFGRSPTEETRIKISLGRRGIKHSLEAREKIRRAMKIRVFSVAHRSRISDGLRRMHAARKAAKV